MRRVRRRSPSHSFLPRAHHERRPQVSRARAGGRLIAPAPCEYRSARGTPAPPVRRATHRRHALRQRHERPRLERVQRDHASQGSAAGHSVDQASLERSGLIALRARIALWDSSVDRVQSHRGAASLADPRGTRPPIRLPRLPNDRRRHRAASAERSPPPSPRSLPCS